MIQSRELTGIPHGLFARLEQQNVRFRDEPEYKLTQTEKPRSRLGPDIDGFATEERDKEVGGGFAVVPKGDTEASGSHAASV